MRSSLTVLALGAASVLVLTGVPAARAEEPQQQKKVERIVIVHAGAGDEHAALPDPASIPCDHLTIDDLDSLAVGETRSYATESGREVTVTRREGAGERYSLAVDGQQIEIGGDEPAGGPGMKKVIVRRQSGDQAGQQEVEEEVTTGGGLPHLALAEGGKPPVVIEILGNHDGKLTKRVIVLRTEEKTDKQ